MHSQNQYPRVLTVFCRMSELAPAILTTLRTQNRMNRRDMLKMIRNTTEEHLGKRLGVQMIRVLRVTEAAEEVNQTTELRAQMGHGPLTQFQYVSK